MSSEPEGRDAGGLRAYIVTAVVLDTLLAAAGFIYGGQEGISPAVSTPIIIAFLVQAAMLLLPGFPGARKLVEQAFAPRTLAALLVAGGIAPYLIFSIPLGLFSAKNFLGLFALASVAPALFVLAPPKKRGLAWQDVVVIALLAAPVISGLTSFLIDAYRGPLDLPEDIRRLDVLGKLMVISVGSMAFFSLRGIEDVDFRFFPSWKDLKTGARHFLYYLAIGAPLSLAMGLVAWTPRAIDWELAADLAGTALGIFFATALGEELCFRGILQNLLEKTLRKPLLAQAIGAAAFGAVHLTFRTFPNWEFTLAAMIAGWFYGNAFREGRSVGAARATHTLVVLTWSFLFR
ncbi:MAG: CPBP family intramembrane metalloprotease [Acidobacteria bacterium]|nr:CPBP family intramembrane metalloprotease [Acidobacteriota bacterium]MDA1237097.1 CPBP family intramembrane metalloprotease [Acidobacteriota bacterium]